jgi:hypothetical protein
MAKIDRKQVANTLKKAAAIHFSRKYAVNFEVGLVRKGKRRADVYCFSMSMNTVIVEVKSCWADFTTDNKKEKWKTYLKYADQFYFLAPHKVAIRIVDELEAGIGVMYLCPRLGRLKVLQKSRKRPVADDIKWNMLMRCAYRGALHTKRNTKKQKVFFND